jgi:hypothetical protein
MSNATIEFLSNVLGAIVAYLIALAVIWLVFG